MRGDDETKIINPELKNDLMEFVGKVFPDTDTKQSIFDACYYTMNDNENFILDFHPDNANIIFGGGFSGHGFKFAPLIGTILSDLALQSQTAFTISKFRFGNF